jgi:thioredoxin-like negative regulator of GroEL
VKKIALLGILLLLPGCYSVKDVTQKEQSSVAGTPIIDLLDSTRILRELIQTNKIGDLLENHDDEQLEALLNNMSPAQMAVEVEMIRTPVPVIAYFFEPGIRHDHLLPEIKDLAHVYDQKVKFVLIDGPKLFQLYDIFAINALPTVLFLKNGEVVARLEDDINRGALQEGIATKFMS